MNAMRRAGLAGALAMLALVAGPAPAFDVLGELRVLDRDGNGLDERIDTLVLDSRRRGSAGDEMLRVEIHVADEAARERARRGVLARGGVVHGALDGMFVGIEADVPLRTLPRLAGEFRSDGVLITEAQGLRVEQGDGVHELQGAQLDAFLLGLPRGAVLRVAPLDDRGLSVANELRVVDAWRRGMRALIEGREADAAMAEWPELEISGPRPEAVKRVLFVAQPSDSIEAHLPFHEMPEAAWDDGTLFPVSTDWFLIRNPLTRSKPLRVTEEGVTLTSCWALTFPLMTAWPIVAREDDPIAHFVNETGSGTLYVTLAPHTWTLVRIHGRADGAAVTLAIGEPPLVVAQPLPEPVAPERPGAEQPVPIIQTPAYLPENPLTRPPAIVASGGEFGPPATYQPQPAESLDAQLANLRLGHDNDFLHVHLGMVLPFDRPFALWIVSDGRRDRGSSRLVELVRGASLDAARALRGVVVEDDIVADQALILENGSTSMRRLRLWSLREDGLQLWAELSPRGGQAQTTLEAPIGLEAALDNTGGFDVAFDALSVDTGLALRIPLSALGFAAPLNPSTRRQEWRFMAGLGVGEDLAWTNQILGSVGVEGSLGGGIDQPGPDFAAKRIGPPPEPGAPPSSPAFTGSQVLIYGFGWAPPPSMTW